jgi:hypothetical protein
LSFFGVVFVIIITTLCCGRSCCCGLSSFCTSSTKGSHDEGKGLPFYLRTIPSKASRLPLILLKPPLPRFRLRLSLFSNGVDDEPNEDDEEDPKPLLLPSALLGREERESPLASRPPVDDV